MFRPVFLLVNLFLLTCAHAQQVKRIDHSYIIRHLTTANGLMENEVSMMKDSRGIMWFYSYSGLQTFDGNNFHDLSHKNGDDATAPHRMIMFVIEGNDGRIWVGGEKGLAAFDYKTHKFYTQEQLFPNTKNLPSTIFHIVNDNKNGLWIFDKDDALFHFNYQTKKLELVAGNYRTLIDTIPTRINQLTVDNNNNIWGVHNNGIFLLNTKTRQVTTEFSGNYSFIQSLKKNLPSNISWDKSRKCFWFVCDDRKRIVQYVPSTGAHYSFAFSEDLRLIKDGKTGAVNFGGIWVDTAGNVWFSTNNECLVRLNARTNDFEYFRSQPNDPTAYWGLTTNDLGFPNFGNVYDASGDVWIGMKNGINIIPGRNRPITHYPVAPEKFAVGESMFDIGVLRKIQHDKYLAVSNRPDMPRLMVLDKDFKIEENILKEHAPIRLGNVVKNKIFIATLSADRKPEDIFHAHYGDYFLDLQTLKLETVDPGRAQKMAFLLPKGKDGLHWYYFNDVCYSYDPNLGKIDSFTVRNRGEMISTGGRQALHPASNTLWVPVESRKEILCIDLNTKKTRKVFGYNNKDSNAVWADWIQSIITMDDDHVMAKANNEINIINVRTGNITHVSSIIGGYNSFSSPAFLYRKKLWMLGGKKIYELDLGKRTKRELQYQKDFTVRISPFILEMPPPENGELLVAVYDGILKVNIDSVFNLHRPSNVRITGANIDGRFHPVDSLIVKGIDMKHDGYNNITLYLSDLNYYAQDRTMYEYALQQGDKITWTTIEGRPEISFRNLAPGKYHLLLRAKNSYGDYSPAVLKMPIVIHPPFWKSWTFFIISLLAVFAITAWIAKKRIRRIRNLALDQADTIRKMSELEMQGLRAQLNPHFMFNSLNAIQELILMEQNDKAQTYLARFSKLLRMLLENADAPLISLRKELQFLDIYLSLENLRVPDMKFEIITEGIDTDRFLIPNMILQPYVENAIWHGLSHKKDNKNLVVRVSEKDGQLNVEIEDNGVGRKRAAELKSLFRKGHKSKGMELLERRFALLSAEYGAIQTKMSDVVEETEVKGTLVQIKIPFSLSLNKSFVNDQNNYN